MLILYCGLHYLIVLISTDFALERINMKNLKIGIRLFAGFAVVIVFLIIGGLLSYKSVVELSALTEEMYLHPYAVSTNIRDVGKGVENTLRRLREMAAAQNQKELDRLYATLHEEAKVTENIFHVLEQSSLKDQDKIKLIEKLFLVHDPISEKLLKEKSAKLSVGDIVPVVFQTPEEFTNMRELISGITVSSDDKSAGFYAMAKMKAKRIEVTIVVIFSVGIVLGIIISLWIGRGIVKPLNYIAQSLERIIPLSVSLNHTLTDKMAKGDWRETVSLHIDEKVRENVVAMAELKSETGYFARSTMGIFQQIVSMADSINMVSNQINEILTQVTLTSDHVATGAAQVASASESLSQGSTESAASLEEITSSMTQLGSQTDINAENAAQANTLAIAAADAVSLGQERMAEMADSMSRISRNSEEIQKVIKTIDDIAFQTNLLALNAAVEAARAGVHGKGFAVVAEEVRNLAARSARAAAETADLIENNNKEVQQGVENYEQTASALSEIVENITKTSDLVGEIASASLEQAQGISQTNAGLAQIDSVTQQNTANAEETASATAEMTEMAGRLNQLISHFTLKAQRSKNKVLRRKSREASAKNEALIPLDDESAADMVRPEEQIRIDEEEFAKF